MFNLFLPDNPCRKGSTGRAITMEYGELFKSTLIVIFWFRMSFARMVHDIWKEERPWTSRSIAKVANILKERATLSTESK